jgi:hypothetical protein
MGIFKSLFGPSKDEIIKKLEKESLENEKKRIQEREDLIAKEEREILEKQKLESEKKEKLNEFKIILSELDKDDNGIIDIADNDDFHKILMNNQEKIIAINRDYIKQFVQISNFLKTKKKSIQSIFQHIKETINNGGSVCYIWEIIDFKKYLKDNNKLSLAAKIKSVSGLDLIKVKQILDDYINSNDEELKSEKFLVLIPLDNSRVSEYFGILKNDIHIYNLLILNSLNMIESLVNNDMITFYEIYERFDELNMFDSKHERDLNIQLNNLNNNLEDVLNQIQILGEDLMQSIGELTSITEKSTERIINGLGNIESKIDTNNLISSIQTYQLYRVNKNTKSLQK